MSVIQKARPGVREGLGPGHGPEHALRVRKRRIGPAFGLVLAFLAAAAGAFWWVTREPESAAPPVVEQPLEQPPLGAAEPAPLPEVEPAPEPEVLPEAAPPAPAAELPPRGKSDGLARELAGSVSSHPLFLRTLQGSGAIDRFVLFVDNLADGRVSRRELEYLRPKGRFRVLGGGAEERIDPASYPRYGPLAEAIGSLDARAAVAAYRKVEPLCEESYRALGYPEGGFEKRLRAALALLLSTPIVDDDPAVVPETKRFEFADPELESLSDAQKQLLRMGPENGRRVRAKLSEIQAALAAG